MTEPDITTRDLSTNRSDFEPGAQRLSAILLICVIGWAIFTLLNGPQGRLVSATIDLIVTLGLAATRQWAKGKPERTVIATHIGGVFNSLGLTIVSLIQGQSSAMASWFLVASPFFAGFIAGARAAKIWSAIAIIELAIVHLSGLVIEIKPEFVHKAPEVWMGAVVLVLAQLAFSLASIRIQKEDIARRIARENVISEQAKELVVARDDALAGARAKDEFLALMSHEIRTPLNGMLGMAELLSDSSLSVEQRRHVETIRASGEALRGILSDILDASKIEAGKLDIEHKPLVIRDIVEQCVLLLGGSAQKKGLELKCLVADDVPKGLEGDALRIRQVILNLMGNAIKFTETGHVAVEIKREPHSTEQGANPCICVIVRDTGVGISKDGLTKLFEPFSQSDSSSRRRFEGTGLGLAISRRLARLMGGDVWVESEIGVGSSFFFRFPLVETLIENQGTETGLQEPVSVKIYNTLVVEDNEVNQRVARGMLEKLGHRCDVADSGEMALLMLERKEYDLVFMDMRMPGLDGVETTQLIRNDGGITKQPWIIAMTANASEADRRRCFDAGMNDFMPKPVSLLALRRAIASIGESRGLLQRTSEGNTQQPLGGLVDKKVLEQLGDLFALRSDLISLLEQHITDSARLVGVAESCLEASDVESMRKAVHSLKGACGAVGAIVMAKQCGELETLIKENRRELLREKLVSLTQVMQDTNQWLRDNFGELAR